jgi:hypothetical protein
VLGYRTELFYGKAMPLERRKRDRNLIVMTENTAGVAGSPSLCELAARRHHKRDTIVFMLAHVVKCVAM